MTRHSLSIIIAIMIVCCLQSSGLALTNEDVFAQFQFNFITPGARATGMGGAFIGLADDATAAVSNPAGLTALTDPEISAEFKYITYTTEQIFENARRWTEIRRMEFEDSVTSIPFASIVYPINQFVVSLYRQESANYKSSYRTGAYPIVVPEVGGNFFPIDASVELLVVNYGIGTAIELFEGFSLAVSPQWSQMNMTSHSARFDGNLLTDEADPTDFSDFEVINETKIDDSDNGFSLNAGIKWDPHPKFSIGAVYRSGAKFTVYCKRIKA